MIVTTPAAPSRTIGRDGDVAWRCLVRRGMLFSECEAVDLVRLSPGAVFAPSGTEGVESAWFVLRGDGTVLSGTSPAQPVRPGDVVLLRPGTARLEAGAEGLEFLWVAVLPAAVTRVLPPRAPVAP